MFEKAGGGKISDVKQTLPGCLCVTTFNVFIREVPLLQYSGSAFITPTLSTLSDANFIQESTCLASNASKPALDF